MHCKGDNILLEVKIQNEIIIKKNFNNDFISYFTFEKTIL